MKPGRDILSGYGPDASKPQRASASCGGVLPGETKDVMRYSPPQGPIGIMRGNSVGLGGTNHGNSQRPVAQRSDASGSVGLHGNNRGIANKP